MEVKIGQFASVKRDVWDEWLLRGGYDYNNAFKEQPIISIGKGKLEGFVMLAFPNWWWKIEEIEPES